MGGDTAPASVVEGAVLAAREMGLALLLVGDEPRLRDELARHPPAPTIRLVHAPTVVAMDESPSFVIRRRRDSSIWRATELVKRGEADAVVSAGHTGGSMATSFFLVGTLQHSQFWIAFTGPWGRLFLSPAHHQIHHSTDPAHFNKNLGNFLGLCDWLAGTLHVPGKKREKLIFGVEPRARDAHSFQGAIIAPVRQGLRHIRGVFLRTAKVQGLRQERWQQ